tara:strand:+ start:522 stop:785 length:264 start_codon:yes stop_codon:yes gene_type:complete
MANQSKMVIERNLYRGFDLDTFDDITNSLEGRSRAKCLQRNSISVKREIDAFIKMGDTHMGHSWVFIKNHHPDWKRILGGRVLDIIY